MPHLTLHIAPSGPIFSLRIGVSAPRELALRAAGEPVPPTAIITALIDTGASSTCIDEAVLRSLNLTPTGTAPVTTPSTGTEPVVLSQYDVSLYIVHPSINLRLGAVPVLGTSLASQELDALIGRDVLSQCLFVYDGQAEVFVLAF